jgi:hypothetical protein
MVPSLAIFHTPLFPWVNTLFEYAFFARVTPRPFRFYRRSEILGPPTLCRV